MGIKTLFILSSITSLTLVAAPAKVSAPELEDLLVTKIVQSGNFFPGPGKRKPVLHSRLTVSVMSSGCTKPEDFEVKVAKKDGRQHVSIVRTRLDDCEHPAAMEEIELSTTELEYSPLTRGAKISVRANPITIENPFPVEERVSH